MRNILPHNKKCFLICCENILMSCTTALICLLILLTLQTLAYHKNSFFNSDAFISQ